MAGFGQVFIAFEARLTSSLADGVLNERLLEIYEMLHLPQMLRTEKLQNDIALIKDRLEIDQAEELELLADQSRVFATRIDEELSANPHVMLAYCWSMYLALFNGGRIIQKLLNSAGAGFWKGEPLPLSFWDFEGDASEVEHLKNTCKERFLVAASLMTDAEKDDVIEGTNRLFDLCAEIVSFLDNKIAVNPPPVQPAAEKLGHAVAPSTVVGAFSSSLAGAYATLRGTTSSLLGPKAIEVDNN